MLTALAQAHSEALSTNEIHELYERRIGLLVRRGNPRHLFTLADLADPDIQVLDVQLEQMEEFQDQVPGLRERLAASVRTGEEGLRAWQTRPELDAWITFESWYRATSSDTDFIPLPDDIGALRPTVIAMTRWTARRTLAREFISFLRSPRAHDVFRRRGWL
jgi:accessory colonization factor AcfC